MLGFSSFSELPISAIPRTPVTRLSTIPVEILTELVASRTIPVEMLGEILISSKMPIEINSSVLLVDENRSLPIETLTTLLENRKIPVGITTNLVSTILQIPVEIIGAKTTPEGLKWVLNSRGTTWEVSAKLMELIWKLGDSRDNTWKIE